MPKSKSKRTSKKSKLTKRKKKVTYFDPRVLVSWIRKFENKSISRIPKVLAQLIWSYCEVLLIFRLPQKWNEHSSHYGSYWRRQIHNGSVLHIRRNNTLEYYTTHRIEKQKTLVLKGTFQKFRSHILMVKWNKDSKQKANGITCNIQYL